MAARAITAKDINALTGRTYPGVASRAWSPVAALQRFAAWYARDRKYRETVSELSRLSDHVLADIGVGRHQIRDIARTVSRRDQVSRAAGDRRWLTTPRRSAPS